MDVTWMSSDDYAKPEPSLVGAVKQLKSRHYFDINLTGSLSTDAAQLASLDQMSQQLAESKNYKNAIRINFGKHAKYQTIITAFNKGNALADSFKLARIAYGDSFYLIKIKPAKQSYKPQLPPCGGVIELSENIIPEVTLTNLLIQFIDNLKNIWLPCALLILMLPVLSKHFKNRTHNAK